jgi:SOS-response transcriptional repressor LexA
LNSNFSIQKKLHALREKGYLSYDKSNAARNIRLTGSVGETVLLNILGVVTAGIPIEAIEVPEPTIFSPFFILPSQIHIDQPGNLRRI